MCIQQICSPDNLIIHDFRLCRRAHEQDLAKRHEREMGELNVVRHRETQIMLADFNKAQEVLKDKISALQIL